MNQVLTVCRDKLREWGLERSLEAVVIVLFALLLLQAGRFVFAGYSARSLAQRVKAIASAPERSDRKPMTEYAVILDKGLLGKKEGPKGPPQGPSLNVYGVLGKRALLGSSPDDAKPFEAGKPLPSGEMLVEITPTGVVLEKDGKKRTLSVFPELGTQPVTKSQGNQPRGDKPQGDKPQGDKPQGDKPQGDKPASETPAVPTPPEGAPKVG